LILVTGAGGFLGHHLLNALSQEDQPIRALYHHTEPSQKRTDLKNVQWQKADLLDIYDVADAMKDITQVYHCAAVVSFNSAQKEQVLHTNVEITANIVNEALEQHVDKLIHISSVGALGKPQEGNKEITENEEWEESHQKSAYGISKYLSELEVWRGIGEGLNAAILNPGIILGEGDWNKGSCHLFKNAYNQFPYYTEGINAWIDVADLVDMAQMLMQSDIQAERFIASCGNFSYRHILTLMAHALGKKPPQKLASAFLSSLIGNYGEFMQRFFHKPALISRETARTAQQQSFFNNEKWLKQFPNFRYRNLEDSIHRIAQGYLSPLIKKN
jgi:nucleoside-diphosphate-sugar epimerase